MCPNDRARRERSRVKTVNENPTDKLCSLVATNNPDEAARELAAVLQSGTSGDSVLSALAPLAASCLQLHYPTPHALIALEWTRIALAELDARDAAPYLIDACVRYVASCPKANLGINDPATPGEPDIEDSVEGTAKSLAEHRVFDALFYATRAFDEPTADRARQTLLTLAGHEVDGLGHVFIYTASSLRVLDWCDAADRPLVLLAISEFLSRRARFERPSLLTEERPLAALIARSFDRTNILGHNVIYAAELNRAPDVFPDEILQHLFGQLARNIDNADLALIRDAYQEYRAETMPGGAQPINMLRTSFAEGDAEGSARAVAFAWAHPPAKGSLPATVFELFARIDAHQAHNLIYPAATFSVLDRVEESDAEFAVAQLVHYGATAAARDGLRPRAFAAG
jgi:hypothetical protein